MINKHPKQQTLGRIFIAGIEGKSFDITIKDGRFSSIVESGQGYGESAPSGQDLWISPGVIDLHTHLAWTDFDHD
ncbi:MAG TPA: amidohydrolase, partial [Paenibacillus sp.]